MKKIYSLILGAVALFVTSCDDKLDIVPLGMTTLTTVDDIESLLNSEWMIFDPDKNFEYLCNQSLPRYANIDEIQNQSNSVEHALVFCDETVDRVMLAEEDERYSFIYKNINYMNIVISKLPDADGDASKKERLMSEARVLRAYFHFLAVNFYARQYDEATAATTGGVAYVDNTNSGEQKKKLSVAEVYNRILDDCTDEIISKMSQSPADDPCRIEADFGYAVRARVLFQMKRYAEALKYADKALAVNPVIEDRSYMTSTKSWTLPFDSPNNYIYIDSWRIFNQCHVNWRPFTPELAALFEDGDYWRNYSGSNEWRVHGKNNNYGIPGSVIYTGKTAKVNVFGLRSEQMYYVAGESLVRTGKIDEGLARIDMVRAKRIHPDKFVPFKDRADVKTEKDAVKLIRNAKRVEFVGCYETFFECKRLNSEPEYAEDIVHDCGSYGKFTVKPDSPLWVYPFPMTAVNYNESLTQNY